MKKIVAFKNWLKITPMGIWALRIRRNKIGSSKKSAYKVIKRFVPDELTADQRRLLLNDMILWNRKYHFSYFEYFLYDFPNKNESERKEFVSDSERVELCESFNDKRNQHIFDDKYLTAITFSEFFGRECLLIQSRADRDCLCSFLNMHRKVIAKPLSSACGQGIQIYTVENDSEIGEMTDAILQRYCKGVFGGGNC